MTGTIHLTLPVRLTPEPKAIATHHSLGACLASGYGDGTELPSVHSLCTPQATSCLFGTRRPDAHLLHLEASEEKGRVNSSTPLPLPKAGSEMCGLHTSQSIPSRSVPCCPAAGTGVTG